MNQIIFSGKLLADAKAITNEKGGFLSLIAVETGKGDNLPVIEITQNFKGAETPKIAEWLKKFAKVVIVGTPYAKIGKKDGKELPVLAVFADKIDIIEFAPKLEETNGNKD